MFVTGKVPLSSQTSGKNWDKLRSSSQCNDKVVDVCAVAPFCNHGDSVSQWFTTTS